MPVIIGVTSTGILVPILVTTTGKIMIDSLPAGSANIGDVDILTLPAIPAGSNLIGKVDVNTLPSIPAGSNNIGDVDVLTLPALPAGTNEIGKVQARNYGLVSGAFQKDPIRFGYSGVVARFWSNTNLAAGTNDVDDSAVPAGEIWIITSFAFNYIGTSPAQCRRTLVIGGTVYRIDTVQTPTSNVIYGLQSWWVLEPGNYLRVSTTGATATDDLYCYATGFQVDIDQ